MHFKKNGFKGPRELEIEVYPVPARYRKMLEYIPNSAEVLADGGLGEVRERQGDDPLQCTPVG